jgi:hypothetical protein
MFFLSSCLVFLGVKVATVQETWNSALFTLSSHRCGFSKIAAWVYLSELKGTVESLAEGGKPEARFAIPGQRPCEHDEVAAVADA